MSSQTIFTCDVCQSTVMQDPQSQTIPYVDIRISDIRTPKGKVMGDFSKAGEVCSASCARRMLTAFCNTLPHDPIAAIPNPRIEEIASEENHNA